MKGRTLLLMLVAAGLSVVLWREYPAMIRYLKIKRM
ncbi:DUF6893 family small protein [Amycolatopsis taiwanensis]